METEEWRDIQGYEGLYQASSLGRIRGVERMVRTKGGSLRAERARILATVENKGYLQVTLCKGGKRKLTSVHKAVMLAFEGPPPEGMEIRHLDGVRKNNRKTNLVYGTNLENMRDRDEHGTTARGDRSAVRLHPEIARGERNGRAKLTDDKVRALKMDLASGASERRVAKTYGISRSALRLIKSGETWAHVTVES
jgi:hypothetical protein